MSSLSSLSTKGSVAVAGLTKRVPVKSIISTNRVEANRNVRGLYKQWIRSVPDMITTYKLPFSEKTMRNKIRQEFYKNSHIRDVRVTDLMIVKSQMDLQETLQHWKQTCHIMEFFGKPTDVVKADTFMGKFLTEKH